MTEISLLTKKTNKKNFKTYLWWKQAKKIIRKNKLSTQIQCDFLKEAALKPKKQRELSTTKPQFVQKKEREKKQ